MIDQKNKIEYIVIAIILIINLILQLIAYSNVGYSGDELYFIDGGRHLAFGYLDFAPIIGLFAYIQNLFHSESIIINHLFVIIASALTILFTGLSIIKLGGKWIAVLAGLSFIIFTPGFGASFSIFSPGVFEQLAYILFIYFLICFCNTSNDKYLFFIAISAALGFLSKYSMLFIIAGFFISVLILKRDLLKKKVLWLCVLIFLAMTSPNIIWQFFNGLPVIYHFSMLYKMQLDNISRLSELKDLISSLNPFTSVFWISGLIVTPFVKSFKPYRLLNLTIILAFILLLIANGKSYYYFPIILGAMPLGTILFEQFFQKRKWIILTYSIVTCITGIMILPMGLKLLPLDKFIKVYHLQKNADNKIPLILENFYQKDIWIKILEMVSDTYNKLTDKEKIKCLIWGRHYSEAGIINLFKDKYSLPRAFSFHGSCYKWVPDFSKDFTIIVISETNLGKDHWEHYFQEVNEVGTVENSYTANKKWYEQRIFLCRKLKYDSSELKAMFKDLIF